MQKNFTPELTAEIALPLARVTSIVPPDNIPLSVVGAAVLVIVAWGIFAIVMEDIGLEK